MTLSTPDTGSLVVIETGALIELAFRFGFDPADAVRLALLVVGLGLLLTPQMRSYVRPRVVVAPGQS